MKKKETHKISYWLSFVVGLLLVSMIPFLSVNATQEGTLTIQRFQVEQYKNLQQSTGQREDVKDVPAEAQIIENIEFKVEKLLVASTDTQVTPSTPLDTSFAARIQKTDANGESVFTNLPKGYYLVSEGILTGHNAQARRFVVQIPNTVVDASGNETTNYDVVVYPKGQSVQVEKSVSSEKEVVGIGDIISWDVLYPMGPDLKREEIVDGVTVTSYGKNFYLTDEMDPRLDYVEGSVAFRYYDMNENEITNLVLQEGIDYHLPYDAATHVLTISFTDNIGTKKVADANVAYIKMALDTRVNASALDTVEVLWNNARIVFENTSGDPYEHEVFPKGTNLNDSRVPKVHLGQIAVTKVDAQDSNIYLAGATFYLADSKENAKAGNFLKRAVDEKGTLEEIHITTDSSGQATIHAISAGTYYLVETQAPQGYAKLTEPIQLTVANDGRSNITRIEVSNMKEKEQEKKPPDTEPPLTGPGGKVVAEGVQTGDIVRITGILMLIIASVGMIIVYIRREREKRREI